MEVPTAVYLDCPSCGEETLHRVIKGSLSDKKDLVLDALVKCSRCGFRHKSLVRSEKPRMVPIIVSEEAQSRRDEIEIPSRSTISIGDEFLLDRGLVKITAIETQSGRVESSPVSEVTSLWAKKFDRLKLKVSINKGSKTFTRTVWAVPDEEFFVGDVMRIKGLDFTIHRIKTHLKSIKKGSAQARDIIRLYGKVIR